MTVQQSLVLIKPDALVKSLTGNIITVLSETKLTIVGAKMISVSRELAEKHYHDLKQRKIKQHGEELGTKIFEETIKYIQGHYHTKRVMAMVYEGEDAINKIRKIAGVTNPEKADPTTLRGKYGRINSTTGVFENVIHASEDEAQAEREIKLWFRPNELTHTIYPSERKEEKIETWHWK